MNSDSTKRRSKEMEIKNKLYGDGIHDDYPAIQEMIDSGVSEIFLPAPEKLYLISKTLTLPSNFKLTLPRFAEIRLMDMSNCPMISNKMVADYAERIPEEFKRIYNGDPYYLWAHVNMYSPDAITENIEIEGGIWNFNNMNQLANPEQTHVREPYGYSGDGMLFYGVKGIRMSNMTFKDPVHYGATFDRVSYFTIENITFDYNMGNPYAVNLDGVHFDGNCHYGVIRNLKGTCYDDLVALNAHEGSRGDITNITIDGIYSENCHSAVRLLAVQENIENIHITNVYGTYYQYGIGITKFYPGEASGRYDGIRLDHLYMSKAERRPEYMKGNGYIYPLLYVQNDLTVKNLVIDGVHRIETDTPVETIYVGQCATVENMIVNDVTQENHTDKGDMPVMVNKGTINKLQFTNIRAGGQSALVNNGEIGEIKE